MNDRVKCFALIKKVATTLLHFGCSKYEQTLAKTDVTQDAHERFLTKPNWWLLGTKVGTKNVNKIFSKILEKVEVIEIGRKSVRPAGTETLGMGTIHARFQTRGKTTF